MRQFSRLLNRRTKSEGDISTLQFQQDATGVTTPVTVPLQVSLPSFDPTRELYAAATNSAQGPIAPNPTDGLNAKIIRLESQVVRLQEERSTLERDLAGYRAELLHARTELYSEMLRNARGQQLAMDDLRVIQKLEARHQRFCVLLVDIGIPQSTVSEICEVLLSGNGSPDGILVDAIKDATDDNSTLLARLKPIVAAERTPEHYQSALNLTLSIRKELRSQKKKCKFWKKLAQEDGRHSSTVTPSSSSISSIRHHLSPERQNALESLVARRRAVMHPENTESDVFGGRRRESALDTLASSLASRPRYSIQDDLRLSSSLSSSSASSVSTTHLSYLSALSRIPRGATIGTPTMPSHLPSALSTSLRRSSRGTSQPIVLGNISLNVSRRSSIDPTLPDETDQNTNPSVGPASTMTHSQDLLQNVRRASQSNGHRRMSSASSRRSGPTRSGRSSFRFSAISSVTACRPAGSLTTPDLDISGNTAVDTPSFHMPSIMMRLSDLATDTNPDLGTPASSAVTSCEGTPFNDTLSLPKYGDDTPFSPSDLEPQVGFTPLEGFVPCKPLDGDGYTCDTRLLGRLDYSMSMSMSTSTSVSVSESSADTRDGHERKHEDDRVHTNMGTIPLGESNDSLFTTSASASVSSSLTANETPAPTTPPTPSPSPIPGPSIDLTPSSGKASTKRSMLPVLAKRLRRLSLSSTSPDRGRLVDRLRGLRSLSRSRSGSGSPFESVWRSPVRSESSRGNHLTPSPSPAKGSGVPVPQRRMTIRARRTSMRKI